MRLARLESLEIKTHGPKIKGAKSAFIGDIEVYLPLKDMLAAGPKVWLNQKKRIQNELNSKEKFVKSLESKLKNQEFLKKAPKEIVEREKARLAAEKEQLTKLKKCARI